MSQIPKDTIRKRLGDFREKMAELAFDAVIVRSTDEYLNEYIPLEENDRYYLSGFSGSTGDLLISDREAYLFVDGRYHTQAEKECDGELISVVKVALNDTVFSRLCETLIELAREHSDGFKVSVDGRKISYDQYLSLEDYLTDNDALLSDWDIEELSPGIHGSEKKLGQSIELIPLSITGRSVEDKLMTVQKMLYSKNCEHNLISTLDDVAYICNFRSYDIAYNSTVKGFLLLGRVEGHLFLSLDEIPDWLRDAFNGILHVHLEKEWGDVAQSIIDGHKDKEISIGLSPSKTTYRRAVGLKGLLGESSRLIEMSYPESNWKHIKSPEELNHMAECFKRSDRVVKMSMDWLNERVDAGDSVSERDLSEKVKELFLAHKAKGLSFEVIAASGENSAIVHYTNPDPDKKIECGELVLLDTGAYYEGGYATDLTRTFLAGGDSLKATAKQKEIYTYVLKAAIRLLRARFPRGTSGSHLDTMARSVLWDFAHVYNHGTGHGVGISVHESPPKISGISFDRIEEGMVFSVEPGIYIEGYGGVRIENLVTVVADSEYDSWLRIEPLTFCPLDKRLIDVTYLDSTEREWLRDYQKKYAGSS